MTLKQTLLMWPIQVGIKDENEAFGRQMVWFATRFTVAGVAMMLVLALLVWPFFYAGVVFYLISGLFGLVALTFNYPKTVGWRQTLFFYSAGEVLGSAATIVGAVILT